MKATSFPRISADSRGLIHSGLTEKIIGIFYEVYNELGHAFLESVYEQALAIALADRGIFFQRHRLPCRCGSEGTRLGTFGPICLSKIRLLLK
jgi:hypothetical protein